MKLRVFHFFLAAVSLLAVCGAAVYRLYALNGAGVVISLLLSGGVLALFFLRKKKAENEELSIDDIGNRFVSKKFHLAIDWKKILTEALWALPYLLLWLFAIWTLWHNRTDRAIVSPWQTVPPAFFIAYLAATAYLFFSFWKGLGSALGLVCAHYFLSFSVLWLVFKLGYGYDPFIHQATLELIDKKGAVEPKPFYYLGQYALIMIAHKTLFLPIAWLGKLLVPALAALTLPPAIFVFLRKKFGLRGLSLAAILSLLVLPFSIFTLTVPQNLAYLFLLLSIFAALTAVARTQLIIAGLLALAALAIHPIAGLPAILFIGARFFSLKIERPKKDKEELAAENSGQPELARDRLGRVKIALQGKQPAEHHSSWKAGFPAPKNVLAISIYAAIFALTIALPPLSFYLASRANLPAAGTTVAERSLSLPALIIPRRENIDLNFIYLFKSNEWLVLILLAAGALFTAWKKRRRSPELMLAAGFFAALLISYFLTSRLDFSFLIAYERDDYAKRILFDAFLFLIPCLAVLFLEILNRINKSRPAVKFPWLVFLMLAMAGSLYGSYPRYDAYFNSHSYAVGKTDLAAVQWIENDASGAPYVVLANQQVAVAALKTFGFNRYHQGDIYFYPIPTGGPLYQYYLDMVYEKPSRQTALAAAELAGVNTAYFAINKYWTNSEKIKEEAKLQADSSTEMNNGEIYIFKYSK